MRLKILVVAVACTLSLASCKWSGPRYHDRLLDIGLPDMNGVDVLIQIKRQRPQLPVLILSMHPEEQFTVNLLRARASGYVAKEAAPEQLVAAIRTVTNGRRYVSAVLADALARDIS